MCGSAHTCRFTAFTCFVLVYIPTGDRFVPVTQLPNVTTSGSVSDADTQTVDNEQSRILSAAG